MTGPPPQPLAGRRIVVTRRPEQSAWLCARLREMGATVLEVPLIEVAPPASDTTNTRDEVQLLRGRTPVSSETSRAPSAGPNGGRESC